LKAIYKAVRVNLDGSVEDFNPRPEERPGVVEDDNLDDEGPVPSDEYKVIMDPNKFYPEDHIEKKVKESAISPQFAEF